MKTFLNFAVALAFILAAREIVPAQQPFVVLKNVQPEYRSLAEVKPALVNESDRSIYLLVEDCGEAQVLFWGKEYWEPSDYPDCPQSTNPVEIKPGDSYQTPHLVIRFKVDEGKFIEEKQARVGKFKILVRYSLNSIYRFGKPQLRYARPNGKPQLKYLREVVKEFSIVK